WSSTDVGRSADADLFVRLNGGAGRVADRLFFGLTEMGSLWAVAAAGCAIGAMGRPREAARAFAAAAATWVVGQAAKRVAGRPRPFVVSPESTRLMIGPPSATSWPSSHPAVLTAFTT